MTDDQIEGTIRKGVGHVQDAVGGLTGDSQTQAEGKFNQIAGSAQDALGQAREKVQTLYDDAESYAKSQPLVALAVASGVGIVIGLLLRGGPKTVYVRR
jgi:uncharacterized protein YjbJ (UPF0337 family)